MIVVIIGLILIGIGFAITCGRKARFKRAIKKYEENAKKYHDEYENDPAPYKASYANWLSMNKSIRKPEEERVKDSEIGFRLVGIVAIVFGLIFLIGQNMSIYTSRKSAIETSANYQEFVDNVPQIVAVDGYGEIVEWNNQIIQCRKNQSLPLLRTHYIFSDDWNDVPLVQFKR